MKYFILILSAFLIAACGTTTKKDKITPAEMKQEKANQNAGDSNESHLTPEEEQNMQVIAVFGEMTEKYVSKKITANQFAQALSEYMLPEVVFWSNYNPSNDSLRPLFSARKGVEAIIERYDYEDRYEKIKPGTGLPFDFTIKGNVIYYSQIETASFFDQKEVTWNMVTKITMSEAKILRIEMYLDAAPIEAVYGSI